MEFGSISNNLFLQHTEGICIYKITWFSKAEEFWASHGYILKTVSFLYTHTHVHAHTYNYVCEHACMYSSRTKDGTETFLQVV